MLITFQCMCYYIPAPKTKSGRPKNSIKIRLIPLMQMAELRDYDRREMKMIATRAKKMPLVLRRAICC